MKKKVSSRSFEHRKFYVYILVFDDGLTHLSACIYYSLLYAKNSAREFISMVRDLGHYCFRFSLFSY